MLYNVLSTRSISQRIQIMGKDSYSVKPYKKRVVYSMKVCIDENK